PPAAGTHRRSRRGSRRRSRVPRAHSTGGGGSTWGGGARAPSWGGWGGASRARNSSSPECSGRTPTRTARTNSCTSPTRKNSPPASRWCSPITRVRSAANSAHVGHVARPDDLAQSLPALAIARRALGRRLEVRLRKLGTQRIEHESPLGQTFGEFATAREHDPSL